MTLADLKKAEVSVGERQGWDFSVMKTERDPIPWHYEDVVREYLKPTDNVLDLGTGGGEVFLRLADSFNKGIGIDSDPEMVKTARERTSAETRGRVSFKIMGAQRLSFKDESFDEVIDRQAPTPVKEIVRVLRPGGYFITQQIGNNNMANINHEFDPNFLPEGKLYADASALAGEFQKRGCTAIAVCSYNVDYYVKDEESMIFWLKAIRSHVHATSAIPEDFSVEKYYPKLDCLLTKMKTPRGYLTNEHRELLIVRKVAKK